MIVDLDKKGDKRMFITEQVERISLGKNGLWSVVFYDSQKIFNYNKSRLLFLVNPLVINLEEKGMYVKNKHIRNVSELLKGILIVSVLPPIAPMGKGLCLRLGTA